MARSQKASEFGGVPGQYSAVDLGEPLPPHLERQALTQTPGGSQVTTDADGVADQTDPAYGTGGQRTKSKSFS